jgi:hypothetical protein
MQLAPRLPLLDALVLLLLEEELPVADELVLLALVLALLDAEPEVDDVAPGPPVDDEPMLIELPVLVTVCVLKGMPPLVLPPMPEPGERPPV